MGLLVGTDGLQERERIARLGHDLRSPLGAIRGFSALLREFVSKHPEDLGAFPLRTLNGIDQASQKMLEIIETAEHESALANCEEAVVERESK